MKNNVVRFTNNRDTWEIDGDQIGEELGILNEVPIDFHYVAMS